MTTEIFVFGSNLAGRHGKGAALHARNFHGAIYGQGVGLQGNSYAIPTKDQSLKSLSLFAINEYVRVFLAFVATNPSLNFNVTRVGCGLAGYTDAQISPMFVAAPINCKLPQGWRTNTLTEFKLIVAGGRDFDDFAMMSETADGLAKGEYANREVSILNHPQV